MGPTGASGNFLDGELNSIDGRQRQVLMNPKQDPFLKDFL